MVVEKPAKIYNSHDKNSCHLLKRGALRVVCVDTHIRQTRLWLTLGFQGENERPVRKYFVVLAFEMQHPDMQTHYGLCKPVPGTHTSPISEQRPNITLVGAAASD